MTEHSIWLANVLSYLPWGLALLCGAQGRFLSTFMERFVFSLVFLAALLISTTYWFEVLGLKYPIVSIVITVACAGFLAYFKGGDENVLTPKLNILKSNGHGIAVFFFFWAYAVLIAPKLVFYNEFSAIGTTLSAAYGDVPMHISYITSFQKGMSFPPHTPMYFGLPIMYPFLLDYWSGYLMRHGFELMRAYYDCIYLFLPALYTAFFLLIRKIGGSYLCSYLSIFLIFFSGVFAGSFQILKDIWQQGFSYLFFPSTEEYAGLSGFVRNVRYFNANTCLFLPQRTGMLGIALTLCLSLLGLHLLNISRYLSKNFKLFLFFILGLGIGQLPLLHAHSFLVAGGLFAAFFFAQKWRDYPAVLSSVAGILIFGVAEILYYKVNEVVKSQISWEPNSFAEGNNFLWFWLKVTGPFFILLFAGFFHKRVSAQLRFFGILGFCIFVMLAFFKFAAWTWDNMKLYIYAFMFMTPLVAFVVTERLPKNILFFKTKRITKNFMFAVLLFGMMSGALSVVKPFFSKAFFEIFSAEDVEFSKQLNSLITTKDLIAAYPNFNTSVYLVGGQVYIGYPGHIWSHGLPIDPRPMELEQFYLGAKPTLGVQNYKVKYALIGPQERRNYFMGKEVPKHWKLLKRFGNQEFYEIP